MSTPKKIEYKAIVWKEGKHFVAQCLNIDVSSFGKSKQEALMSLREAIELYFDEGSLIELPKIENAELITDSLAHA